MAVGVAMPRIGGRFGSMTWHLPRIDDVDKISYDDRVR